MGLEKYANGFTPTVLRTYWMNPNGGALGAVTASRERSMLMVRLLEARSIRLCRY